MPPRRSRKRNAEALLNDAPEPATAANALPSPPPPARKRARRVASKASPTSHNPRQKHCNHPDSGVGKNFHSVPYPLGLMPYGSWHALHHRREPEPSEHRFVCPACRKARPSPSAHKQKLFLVAERLSWEDGIVPTSDRELNQELTWEVNFMFGIYEPAMEDPEQVPGGKNSKLNRWYPFENEPDFSAAMELVARGDDLTERNWALWLRMVDSFHEEPDIQPPESPEDTIAGGSSSTPCPSSQSMAGSSREPLAEMAGNSYLPTPPGSSQPAPSEPPGSTKSPPSKLVSSAAQASSTSQPVPSSEQIPTPASPVPRPVRRSLTEFYSLLDTIERTSFVGAHYLEAYAEHLRDDLCGDCWWKHNILSTDVLPE